MERIRRNMTRRDFLGRLALGGVAVTGLPRLARASAPRSATDKVILGKSGVQVSRLGMGTGSNGGSVQRALGQNGFNRLVWHALDRGITFFDTADNYGEMHEMLREALKGVDRESIQIQCKIPHGRYDDPLKEIDRFRKEVGTDYFDTMLIHHVAKASWPEDLKRLMDQLETAKEQQVIRSHGVSIHGLAPLEAAVPVEWIDLALVRVNHNGHHMDGPTGAWAEQGNRDEALGHIKKLHDNGKGIVGMKIIGNGDFTDPAEREASIRFVMGLDFVDAVVIGFKSPQEIDEAIDRINAALNV
jgi:predicted aldo/keto reductase-like oxidoreductase